MFWPRRALGLLALSLCSSCLTAPIPTPAEKAKVHEKAFMPDWSRAGYRRGASVPNRATTHHARDFGATADDGNDDTSAVRQALESLRDSSGRVVLEFEAGRYDLSEILYLERSDFVLRGAGSEKTTLYFKRPLGEMHLPQRIHDLEQYLVSHDKKVDGELFSRFSWTGGVIWSRLPTADQISFDGLGPIRGTPVNVIGGHRGAHEVTVEDPSGLEVGETYVIRWFNTEGHDSEFLEHLYGLRGVNFGERLTDDRDRVLAEQDATVTSIQGKTLTVEQPLLHDIHTGWKVHLGSVDRLEEVGIEGLTIAFPEQPYRGHHKEAGYNAIHLNDLRNGWVRDVVIRNADSGILSDRSSHITVQGVEVRGRGGHYGVHLGSVYAALVRDFTIAPEFAHSVSFNTRSSGSVFHAGKITDGSLDQHRGANHQNLFDSIVVVETDEASRLFDHGGAGYWGPAHGAYNAFWNIEIQLKQGIGKPLYLGAVKDAGPAYLVGVRASSATAFDYPSATRGEMEDKPSLYRAQRALAGLE